MGRDNAITQRLRTSSGATASPVVKGGRILSIKSLTSGKCVDCGQMMEPESEEPEKICANCGAIYRQ